MQADGKGWLYVPQGLIDGPLPTHYEPVESPVRNPLYGQQSNPTRKVYGARTTRSTRPPDRDADVFPFVFTTYRLTEHHTAGAMSRYVPGSPSCSRRCSSRCRRSWPPSAASSTWAGAHVVTSRSAIEAGCWSPTGCAAARRRPVVHQVWLPYHWGQRRDGHRRLRERPVRGLARPERADPGEQGRHLRRPAGPAAERAARCSTTWRATGRRERSAITAGIAARRARQGGRNAWHVAAPE